MGELTWGSVFGFPFLCTVCSPSPQPPASLQHVHQLLLMMKMFLGLFPKLYFQITIHPRHHMRHDLVGKNNNKTQPHLLKYCFNNKPQSSTSRFCAGFFSFLKARHTEIDTSLSSSPSSKSSGSTCDGDLGCI